MLKLERLQSFAFMKRAWSCPGPLWEVKGARWEWREAEDTDESQALDGGTWTLPETGPFLLDFILHFFLNSSECKYQKGPKCHTVICIVNYIWPESSDRLHKVHIYYLSFSCNTVVLRIHLAIIVLTPSLSKSLFFFVLMKILEVRSVQFPSKYKPSRADLWQVRMGRLLY